jgi:hypothetical protein
LRHHVLAQTLLELLDGQVDADGSSLLVPLQLLESLHRPWRPRLDVCHGGLMMIDGLSHYEEDGSG